MGGSAFRRETRRKYFLKNKAVEKNPVTVEFFSLPGSGNVKCDYEEVIEHEQN